MEFCNFEKTQPMKNLLLLTLLFPSVVFAQKTKLEKDTIYKDNVAYAILTKTGGLEATYSIRSLSNQEVAVAKFDAAAKDANGRDYFRVTFLETGSVGHFPNSINIGRKLAEAVVENNLIVDNAINPEGENRFLALYPNRNPQQPQIVLIAKSDAVDYTPVQRNRTSPISEMNGELKQGGVNIGTCKTSTAMSGGKSIATIKYFLPSGVQCAEATCDNIGAKSATIVTLKDNKTHTITIKNSAMKEKEIAEYLSGLMYL